MNLIDVSKGDSLCHVSYEDRTKLCSKMYYNGLKNRKYSATIGATIIWKWGKISNLGRSEVLRLPVSNNSKK